MNMITWHQTKDPDMRADLLDDQYGLIGSRDTSGNDYPEAIVISLGFAKSLAERFPELGKMIEEEMKELQVFKPKSRLKGRNFYLNGQGSRMR